jgi:hypothetical protein
MSPFIGFTAELLADPVFASSAVALRKMLDQLDVEGDGSVDAIEMARAVEWICNQRQRPLYERVDKIGELSRLKGKVRIDNLRAWCGW